MEPFLNIVDWIAQNKMTVAAATAVTCLVFAATLWAERGKEKADEWVERCAQAYAVLCWQYACVFWGILARGKGWNMGEGLADALYYLLSPISSILFFWAGFCLLGKRMPTHRWVIGVALITAVTAWFLPSRYGSLADAVLSSLSLSVLGWGLFQGFRRNDRKKSSYTALFYCGLYTVLAMWHWWDAENRISLTVALVLKFCVFACCHALVKCILDLREKDLIRETERMGVALARTELPSLLMHEIGNRIFHIQAAVEVLKLDLNGVFDKLAADESAELASDFEDVAKALDGLQELRSMQSPLPSDGEGSCHVQEALVATGARYEPYFKARKIELNIPKGKDIVVNIPLGMLCLCVATIFGNAVDAMRAGGIINCRVDEHPEHVLIAISNNGTPIEAKDRTKIFKGGFSTKTTGSGMGLFLSRNILQRHGVMLTLKDSKETTFEILMPK